MMVTQGSWESRLDDAAVASRGGAGTGSGCWSWGKYCVPAEPNAALGLLGALRLAVSALSSGQNQTIRAGPCRNFEGRGPGAFLKSSWEKAAHFRETRLRSREHIPDQRGCLVDRQRLR
jgi:hypothetical protein